MYKAERMKEKYERLETERRQFKIRTPGFLLQDRFDVRPMPTMNPNYLYQRDAVQKNNEERKVNAAENS